MRLRYGTVLLAGLALLGACGEPAPVEEAFVEPVSDAAGCDVARAYVTERIGRIADPASVVFGREAPDLSFLGGFTGEEIAAPYSAAEAFGWREDAPDPELAAAFLASPPQNPFAVCTGFTALAEDAGLAVGALNPTRRNEEPDARTLLNFTFPVVSEDGASALLMESGGAANGAKADVLVHLRLGEDGAWAETDSLVARLE
jgi:hypothetical protein